MTKSGSNLFLSQTNVVRANSQQPDFIADYPVGETIVVVDPGLISVFSFTVNLSNSR